MPRRLEILIDDIKDLTKRFIKWLRSPFFRAYILKVITISLSALLLVAAYRVHVTYADDYIAFNNITTTVNLNRDVSRGVVFDRNGEPLISNISISVITYRHIPNTYTGEIRRIANELAKLIDIDEEEIESSLTERDKKDLFISLNFEYASNLVSEENRRLAANDNSLFNLMMLEQITEEHLEKITDEQLRSHVIFMRMNQGAGTTTNIIKQHPTVEEVARIMEHLALLPGIDVGVDWQREYTTKLSRDFFGSVSTHQQGIPRDRQAYFLSQGYAANARVGTSQLERSLHSYLAGFQYLYFLDDGEPTRLSQGLPGFNISLNLDTELQLIIEEIVAEELLATRREHPQLSRFLREAYVVVSDPHTGAVLSMVGVVLDDENGVLTPRMHPLGTIQNATTVGSSVKGASLMAGYHYGVTSPGMTRLDSNLVFRGSEALGSWTPMGIINDTTAIYRSSNVYFFRQSMEMAGVHSWLPDEIIQFDAGAWSMYRNFFRQLGLGSPTGIEFPHETTGFLGGSLFHELLHFSIGQADTYTAMQLAQFGAVMATRGNRMQMQLIQNVYMPGGDGENQQLLYGFQPNLLNRIELTENEWDVLHRAHRLVITNTQGTANEIFRGVDFRPAGKTGTSEDFLRNERGEIVNLDGSLVGIHGTPIDLYNRSFVGYAPYDNPEIVVSAIVPQVQIAGTLGGPQNVAAIITRDVMQAYFDLQLERASGR